MPDLKGKNDKQKFILKIYALLSLQLAFTFSFVLITMLVPSKLFNFTLNIVMKTHRWLFWTIFGIFIALSVSIFCMNKMMKRVPINYIVLCLFTLLSTYMTASICSYQDPEVILIAAALTLAIFIGLTSFSLFVISNLFYLYSADVS